MSLTQRRVEGWQLAVCGAVLGYIGLGLATHSLRAYSWFLLLAIPGALLSAERGRRFFVDWAPLLLFWVAYDRLRLVQPLLFPRVAVVWPYDLERLLFGWLAGGDVPAHAAHAWLSARTETVLGATIIWTEQIVYLSHVFTYPALFVYWWVRGLRRRVERERFGRYVLAFTVLNVVGLVGYVLLPVAPPWWVTLHGMRQPTVDLVASSSLAAAMGGSLVARTIQTAPQWFAAIPSLHGAYPVLFFLLARRESSRPMLAAIAAYGAAMWAATVVLNLHYIIDLVAGAIVAVAAYWATERYRGVVGSR